MAEEQMNVFATGEDTAAPAAEEQLNVFSPAPESTIGSKIGGVGRAALATVLGMKLFVPTTVASGFLGLGKGIGSLARGEGVDKALEAANRGVEAIPEAINKKILTTPESQRYAEAVGHVINKPIELSRQGWKGIAELATTGSLEKATDVIEERSGGSSLLIPAVGTLAEANVFGALFGRPGMKDGKLVPVAEHGAVVKGIQAAGSGMQALREKIAARKAAQVAALPDAQVKAAADSGSTIAKAEAEKRGLVSPAAEEAPPPSAVQEPIAPANTQPESPVQEALKTDPLQQQVMEFEKTLTQENPELKAATEVAASDSTGLVSGFKGIASQMTEGLYKGLFESLQRGDDVFAGVKDPVLSKAKPYYEAGLIKSPEDIKKFEAEGYPALPTEIPAVSTGKAVLPPKEAAATQTPVEGVKPVEGTPEAIAPDYAAQAKELGITFNGIQEGVDGTKLPLFTDSKTQATFSVPEGANVVEALAAKRAAFTTSPETAPETLQTKTGEISPEKLINVGAVQIPESLIPKYAEGINAAIEKAHKSLYDTATFVSNREIYNRSFPVPKEGGIVAATRTEKYASDPKYRVKVDTAIQSITDTIKQGNKELALLQGRQPIGEFGVAYSVVPDAPEKVNARYTVDVARAWNMEAKNKYPYTNALGDISIREGLQNSMDAVLSALQKKEITQGEIEFSTSPDSKSFTIKDNGIGMSDTDIATKFLSLHSTGKDVEGRFGGFGIAKAVILGPSETATWELKTRDNFFTHAMAQEEAQVGTVPRMQGTEIAVKTQDRILSSQAKSYVETTAFPKNITAKFNGEAVPNPFEGLKGKKEIVRIDDASTLTTTYYPKAPEGYNKTHILRLVDEKTGAKLTQAILSIYNDGFNGTLISDIKTSATPGKSNYPLTDSRMEMKYNSRATVDKIIEKHSVDPKSARRANVESATSYGFENARFVEKLNKIEADPGYIKTRETVESILRENGDDSGISKLYHIEIKKDAGYKGPTTLTTMQAGHVAAYEGVARLYSAKLDYPLQKFYLLFSQSVEGGHIASEYGGRSLGLNPFAIDKTALKSPLEYALYLRDLVSHELTHERFGKHNEEFTSALGGIQGKISGLFPQTLKMAEAVAGKEAFPERVRTRTVTKETIREVPVETKVAEMVDRFFSPEQQEFIFNKERGAIDGNNELYRPSDPRQQGLFERRSDAGPGTLGSAESRLGARSGNELPNPPGNDKIGGNRPGASAERGAAGVVQPGTPEYTALSKEAYAISQKEKLGTATPEDLARKQEIYKQAGLDEKPAAPRTAEDAQNELADLNQRLKDSQQELADLTDGVKPGSTEWREQAEDRAAIKEEIAGIKQEINDLKKDFRPGPGAQTGAPSSPEAPFRQPLEDLTEATTALTTPPRKAFSEPVNLQGIPSRALSSSLSLFGKVKMEASNAWERWLTRTEKPVTTYDKIFGEYELAKEHAGLTARQFGKQILAKIPKSYQDAVTNYIEAAGDAELLTQRAAVSKDPKLAEGYRKAAEIATSTDPAIAQYKLYADNVSSYFTEWLGRLQEAGVLGEQYVQDYVNHIWESNPFAQRHIQGEMSAGLFKTNPSLARKRIIESYFRGEELGLKPKNKGVGYLVAAYSKIASESLAAREAVEAMFKGKAQDGNPILVPEKATLRKMDNGNQYRVVDPANDRTQTGWTKAERVFETKAEAEAYLKEGDLDYNGDRSHLRIDVKPLVTTFISSKSPGLRSDTPRASNDRPYRPAPDHAALREFVFQSADSAGNPIFYKGRALVHPDHYDNLTAAFAPSTIRQNPVGKVALDVAAFAKATMLDLSGFHIVQLGIHALGHNVKIWDLKDIDLKDPTQRSLVSGGMVLGFHSGMQLLTEGVYGGGLVERIPGIGAYSRKIGDYTFQNLLPRLKMNMALRGLKKNMEHYAGKLTEDQIIAKTATEANFAFGGLNWRKMGISKTYQDVMRLGLLAPDFLIARIGFAKQAFQGVLPWQKNPHVEQTAAMVRLALAQMLTFQTANYFLNGRFQMDRPFSLIVGDQEFTPRSVPGDIIHLLTDPRSFVYHRLNPTVTRTIIEGLTGKDIYGRERDTWNQMKDFVVTHIPIPLQGPFRKGDSSLFQSAVSSIGLSTFTYKTAAEREMSHLISLNVPSKQLEAEEIALNKAKSTMKAVIRGEKELTPEGAEELMKEVSKLSPEQARRIMIDATRYTKFEDGFKRLNLSEGLKVWNKTKDAAGFVPDEKQRLLAAQELARKYMNAVKHTPSQILNLTESEKADLKEALGGMGD